MPAERPRATYRLQLSKDFSFDAAADLVPYLAALGISHLYASPFLKARAGSTHGYDIVDHAALNPEFGGEAAFARLSDALRRADMGLILDFVPNHMGVNFADNAWWLDVLEWGPRSPRARSFDIDWELLPHRRGGGVLLPILGSPYGKALEAGEIVLRYDPAEGSLSAWYFEHRLPISPQRYGDILRVAVASADAEDTAAGRNLLELASRHRHPSAPSYEEAPAFKAAIAAVDGGAEIIERGLEAYRPSESDHAPVAALHRLLERQHYRLAHWRLAVSDINYRRFFDINNLAGLRVEDPRTFRDMHRLVVALIAQGRLHGIRLDHIDGLRDPAEYCRRLQRVVRQAQKATGGPRPFYVVVEKILADGETLPAFEGVAGTTGYEWLNVIARLFVEDGSRDRLEELRRAFSEVPRSFGQILRRAKMRVLETLLASEFSVLVALLARIAAGHYLTRDFTGDRLRLALQHFVIHLPVYRTYARASGASGTDRATIAQAIAAARAEWVGTDSEIFDFLQEAITLDLIGPGRTGYSRARVTRFALKLQQFTGPMLAKSLEDTAFYRYSRLIALNEVGGDPDARGLSIGEFHRRMVERAERGPHGMTATATHDTKRGEDARMRILALSEIADDWAEAVREWHALNGGLATALGGARAPTLGHEYMLYQSLIGAWPTNGPDESVLARMQAFALKAAREGKVETSWTNPDAAYEEALAAFVRGMLDPRRSRRFIASFDDFAQRSALIGAVASLAQLVLKATIPGVPDFYQGTEFWDLALVDPDNRRPVDFAARRTALDSVATDLDWHGLARDWQDGRVKLALTHALLAWRAKSGEPFTHGDYRPLRVSGRDSERVLAFARVHAGEAAIVVVPRRLAACTGGGRHWPQSAGWDAVLHLDGFSNLRNRMDGHRQVDGPDVPLTRLFGPLPLALLDGEQTTVSARRR